MSHRLLPPSVPQAHTFTRSFTRSMACSFALFVVPILALTAQDPTPRPPVTPKGAIAPRAGTPDAKRTPRPLPPRDDEFDLEGRFRFDRWDDFRADALDRARLDMDRLSLLAPVITPFPPFPSFPDIELAPMIAGVTPKFERLLDRSFDKAFDTKFEMKMDSKFEKAFDLDFDSDLDISFGRKFALAPSIADGGRPRAGWLQGDPADSLYRLARELLNNGEYRRAAAAFRDLTTRMPTSGYAADALYWQAFALYRMGGTTELRGAIDALDQQKEKYPGARLRAESDALALRIRGALAARGDAASAATIRTAAGDSALRCDREEQSVRVEALNALTQSDPDGAMPVLQKTLARRDSCSAMMRRAAVFLIGNKKRDGAGTTLLTQVARNDPSVEVRGAALEWLARIPGEEALGTLEELARDSSDERIQRAAVRALVQNPSARARQLVRGIVERNESPERLRLEALGAYDKERATPEDVAWMRALYGRTDNSRIKARIVNTLAGIGGAEVDQWLLAMARNPDESSDTRRYAVRRVGRTLPIPEIARLYDASAERAIRDVLIETLAQRPEGEATDKLLEIVKTGTDPQLRSRAISALTSKKDPRTLRLLMEIIDK